MARENDADNEAYRAAVVSNPAARVNDLEEFRKHRQTLVRRAYKLLVRIFVAGFVAVVVFSTSLVSAGIMVGFSAFIPFMAVSIALKLAGG